MLNNLFKINKTIILTSLTEINKIITRTQLKKKL